MGHPPLSKQMRTRVTVVIVCSALLVLLMLPLAVLSIARGDDHGRTAWIMAIGLGLPAVFGAVMWWGVRRWRADPEVRRREPNRAASRILLLGNLGVFIAGDLVRRLVGGPSWLAWLAAGLVFLVGALVVFYAAKRQDPRLHFFRRPDPLPEDGDSPDGKRSAAPQESPGASPSGAAPAPSTKSRRTWPRLGRYVLAAPVVALMAVALLNDPGRLGESSSAADMPVAGFVGIAGVMTALFAGMWAMSEYRHRTIIAISQVAVVWLGGLLFVTGVRTETTLLDVAEDVVLLATTLLQIIPVRRQGEASTRGLSLGAVNHRIGSRAEGTS